MRGTIPCIIITAVFAGERRQMTLDDLMEASTGKRSTELKSCWKAFLPVTIWILRDIWTRSTRWMCCIKPWSICANTFRGDYGDDR